MHAKVLFMTDSISVNKIIILLYLIPICNRITRKFFKRLRLRFHF